jgi:hypothetical protein
VRPREEIDRAVRQIRVHHGDVHDHELCEVVAVGVVVLDHAVGQVEVAAHVGSAKRNRRDGAHQLQDALRFQRVVDDARFRAREAIQVARDLPAPGEEAAASARTLELVGDPPREIGERLARDDVPEDEVPVLGERLTVAGDVVRAYRGRGAERGGVLGCLSHRCRGADRRAPARGVKVPRGWPGRNADGVSPFRLRGPLDPRTAWRSRASALVGADVHGRALRTWVSVHVGGRCFRRGAGVDAG